MRSSLVILALLFYCACSIAPNPSEPEVVSIEIQSQTEKVEKNRIESKPEVDRLRIVLDSLFKSPLEVAMDTIELNRRKFAGLSWFSEKGAQYQLKYWDTNILVYDSQEGAQNAFNDKVSVIQNSDGHGLLGEEHIITKAGGMYLQIGKVIYSRPSACSEDPRNKKTEEERILNALSSFPDINKEVIIHHCGGGAGIKKIP